MAFKHDVEREAMATDDRISYRLVVKESPLRERYDALLTTLQDLYFEVEPDGHDPTSHRRLRVCSC